MPGLLRERRKPKCVCGIRPNSVHQTWWPPFCVLLVSRFNTAWRIYIGLHTFLFYCLPIPTVLNVHDLLIEKFALYQYLPYLATHCLDNEPTAFPELLWHVVKCLVVAQMAVEQRFSIRPTISFLIYICAFIGLNSGWNQVMKVRVTSQVVNFLNYFRSSRVFRSTTRSSPSRQILMWVQVSTYQVKSGPSHLS